MNARIAVIGGGIIGSAAALALSRAFPEQVHHVAPETGSDERTTALLMDAIDTLRELGVWGEVESRAAPLRIMRLLDGSRRLLRPRPIDFASHEIGLAQFGFNIRNDVLVTALSEAEGPVRHAATLTAMDREGPRWSLRLSTEEVLQADVVVAADGRNSLCRETLGIGARRWSYPQVALVTTFVHERSHGDVSVEFHTATGPFTQVPLPATEEEPHRSSLVWVVRPEEVAALEALDRTELSARDRRADGLDARRRQGRA